MQADLKAGDVVLPRDTSHVESHGVDIIPPQARHSSPKDVFYVFLGSQMCFGIIVIGALPVVFGLSFWASLTSITVGLGLGSILFGFLAPFGAKTGTNGPVASGAHFGVNGKAIGTVMGVLVTLGFYALTVWTGGEAVIAAGSRLFGWQSTPDLLFAGAAVIGVLTVAAAIFGHGLIVKSETFVSYVIAGTLMIAAISLAPGFDAAYPGTGKFAAGSFWPTWLLASSICAALPISYATILNDYTRYLPETTRTSRAVWAASGGMFVGCWLALSFAAYVTTIFKSPDAPFVSGLIGLLPIWLVLVFAFVGIVGSQPQGSLCLYHGGLGMQSLAPRTSRVAWTVLQSVAGMILVWAGIYLANMTDLLIAFLTLIECAVSPWLAINVVGYFLVAKGKYAPHQLLVSNQSSQYWYSGGWNIQALVSWAAGTIVGLLFAETAVFNGPLGVFTGGTNAAWLLAGIAGAILYLILQNKSVRRDLAP
jgi:purine-cytosine permease-like protein